jgi:GNAT superfamily N-acetyltransferase
VLIRPAAPHDAEALTDLHLDVWEEAYGALIAPEILRKRRLTRPERVAQWADNLVRTKGRTLLAWNDEGSRLLGFVSVGPGRDEPGVGLPGLEVWALYVRAETYGHGVGHALLLEAIGADPAYLWVLDGNERAINFYERQGFVFDGVSKTEPEGLERRMLRPLAGRGHPVFSPLVMT